MVYIFKDRIIRIEWTVLKGISNVREDFSRALLKLFLIGRRERYLVEVDSFDNGTVKATIPQGLEEGSYSVELIYVKNWDFLRRGDVDPHRYPVDPRFNDRCLMRTRKDDLFSITEFESEATNIGEGAVVLKVKTSTATYGYDGLSSYQLAVMRGDWNGTEGEWLKHERYVSVLDSRGDSKVDTMSQKAITDELEAQDNAIEDIREDTGKLGERVEEAEKKVNNMGDVVDEIKSHAPVSARPAGFKPDIDLTPEITVDRAWRDHEGNVIRDTYITRRGLRNEIIDITNQQVTDLKPGSVDPDDLSEATKQLIGNKSVTNLPDEEDITVTDNQTLKLKDKEYAPKDYSGMGRVYLRKHYVNSVNTLTQHMMRKPNTIYIIQYDYCLAGHTIEVPENCVLEFQGGSLRKGVLIGNNTELNLSCRSFNNINFRGSFNSKSTILPIVFNGTDDDIFCGMSSLTYCGVFNIVIPYKSYVLKNIHVFNTGSISKDEGVYVEKAPLYSHLQDFTRYDRPILVPCGNFKFSHLGIMGSYQGLTYNPTTRQYALSFSEDSSEDKEAKIVIIDEKFNFVRVKNLKNGGHANDMVYNPNTNELLVVPMKGKIVNIYNWDEDFTPKKNVTINSTSVNAIESIGFDQVNNIYAIKAVTEVIVTDSDFNVLYSHGISLPDMYISQSMEFNNGNLILWCTDRFDLNDDISNNFIVVFSVDGKLLESYNYPALYKYEESEGIVYIPEKNIFLLSTYSVGEIHFYKYERDIQSHSHALTDIINSGLTEIHSVKDRIVYVDNDNNGFYNGTKRYPYPTITEALNHINKLTPMQVVVSPGIYNEDLLITENARLVISNKDPSKEVRIKSIDCSNTTILLYNLIFTDDSRPMIFSHGNAYLNNIKVGPSKDPISNAPYGTRGIRFYNGCIAFIEKAIVDSFSCAIYVSSSSIVSIKNLNGHNNSYGFINDGGDIIFESLNGITIETTKSLTYIKPSCLTLPSNKRPEAAEGAFMYDTTLGIFILRRNGKWANMDGTVIFKRKGTTDERPIIESNIDDNVQYFDTTLNKPIWWNGTNWVDATGATV